MMPSSETLTSSSSITRAAQWIADRKGDQFGAVIPVLKQRFGLTSVQAAEACTLAKSFRICRRAFS